MRDWLTLFIACLLLLQSVVGRQPSSHVSHEHLLLGHVTLEQLRAHIAQEESAGQPQPTSLIPSSGPALQGGIIISVLHGADETRIPVVLEGLLSIVPALVSVIWQSVLFPCSSMCSTVSLVTEPPPRTLRTSF